MSSRRNFLKKVGIGVGAVSVAGIAGAALLKSNEKAKSGGRLNFFLPTELLLRLIRMISNRLKRLLQSLRKLKPEQDFQTGSSQWLSTLPDAKMPENVLMPARKDICCRKIMNG